jgi:tetratricopeptide (TPR) repeat protein
VDIQKHETVETPSPGQPEPQPRPGRLGLLLLLLLAALGAAAVLLYPHRRRLPFLAGPRLITVTITSTPEGADAFVDDRPVGPTPTQAELTPGPRVVRIVRRGYKPWREEIDPAATGSVAPTLQPLDLGALVIESQPDRANVYLDDEHRGVTPIWINNVEAGPHAVRITKEPVYQPVSQQIDLKPNETRRLSVQLVSGIEELYRSRIKAQPAKLSNYTELLHIHTIASQTQKALAVLNQALDALKAAQADPAELRQFYEELLAVYRGGAGALDNATRDQMVDAVLTLFERLALSSPSEPEYYRPLVTFLAQQAKRYDDIAKICDKTVAQGKSSGTVHLQVAQLYLTWGDAKNAIPLLERTEKLLPNSYSVHFQLGSAFHRADRYDDALREYKAAEKLAADALAAKKTSADGVSAYERGTLHLSMARLYDAKGELDNAVTRYKEALKIEITTYYASQWRYQFAQFLEEHSRKSDAIEQYKEIVRLSPDTAYGTQARRALARLGQK